MSGSGWRLARSSLVLLCGALAATFLPGAHAALRPAPSVRLPAAPAGTMTAADYECADAWADAMRISAYITLHRAHRAQAAELFAAQSAATQSAATSHPWPRRTAAAPSSRTHRLR